MSDYISIGKFVAVHGLKGELILKHALGKKTSFKGVKAIFTQTADRAYMPWFIEYAKGRTADEVLIKLEDINTPEAAKKVNQKTIWLTKEDFDQQASQSAAISFIGFMIIEDENELGVITEVIEQPHQILCTIDINGKEVLIPLHQESLLKVDRPKRQIHVNLPEGLIELYTG
ncbi:MAG: ribosome maturation factor RimM [Chitinophagaceae bacterium]